MGYTMEGVSNITRGGPIPGSAHGAYFRIDFTITNFTAIFPQFGPYGEFEVSAAITARALGISNARALNSNLVLSFFDDGFQEEFSLHLYLQRSEFGGVYDLIYFHAEGADFITDPRTPTPLKKAMSDVPLDVGYQFSTAFHLEDGTTFGLPGGVIQGGVRNTDAIPEPTSLAFVMIGTALLLPRTWMRRAGKQSVRLLPQSEPIA